jgi:hypothetical protein
VAKAKPAGVGRGSGSMRATQIIITRPAQVRGGTCGLWHGGAHMPISASCQH